ncbi:hypothetical protein Bca101_032577 [Brassica carinata]
MATSYTLLADLRVGRCSNTAKVHLLRVWEARNINKGGELMSVDMLLIDENMYELFIELTIQLRKWVLNDPYTLSTPSRKRCDDVCVRPSVLNAPFQIPTGYFMKICFSDFMYLFFGLIQYFCSFDVEKHILLSLKSTKVFPNVILVSPVFLHHDSVINLLARKSRRPLLILPTVDHLGGVLFTLYRSPMTISLTGNSNIKPVNVSQALTAGLLQFLLNEKCFFEPLSICQNS